MLPWIYEAWICCKCGTANEGDLCVQPSCMHERCEDCQDGW
ncbi:MAG TPA: hypothetical protein VGN26_12825 [Armatimonadota bacterium]